MRSFNPCRAIIAATAALPTAVFAHADHSSAQDVWHGFMHPIGGLDHVLAMIAVGFIAAQLGGRALWAVPLSFVATMGIAGFFGVAGLALPGIEAGIALSVIVLGAVISLRARVPVTVAASMVAVFAIFHGYSHGLEMHDTHAGAAFGAGFILATTLLHLVGIGIGLAAGRIGASHSQRIAQASGGALVLAGAVLFAAA